MVLVKTYDRYIMHNMVKLLIVVIFMLTIILLLSQSLRFMEYIVQSSVKLSDFFTMLGLLVPWIIQISIPIACYISCFICFYRMRQDNELSILRSIGLSNQRLAKPMLCMGIGFVIIGYIMSLYFVPIALRQFKDKQWLNKESYSSILLQDGSFQMPVKNIMIYINEKKGENLLEGIFVYDKREPNEEIVIIARKAAVKLVSEGVILELDEGSRQARNLTTNKLQILNFQKYPLDLGSYNNPAIRSYIEPQEMPTLQLIRLALGEEEVDNKIAKHHKLLYELQYRFSWPLLSGLFTLIACKATLTARYRRRGNIKTAIFYSILSAALLGLILGLYSITSFLAFSWLVVYMVIFGVSTYMFKTL